MNWHTILPFAAAAGTIIGIATGDFLLVFLAVLLFAGAFFWRSPPEDDDPDR